MRTAKVIGSGPNGLAAAIALAQAGVSVTVHEAADAAGGATRSGELTLPGFTHDLGSAVHPMALSSPYLSKLPLDDHGLQWIMPETALAHPLDDGTALTLERDISDTAGQLGADAGAYRRLFGPLARNWPELMKEALRPLRFPADPLLMASFGLRGLQPAAALARAVFGGAKARAIFAGLAAHSTLRLEAHLSAAFGLILGASGHAVGWPIPAGGSQHIADALSGVLKSLGGRIVTGSRIDSLRQAERTDLTLCDLTPRQFLAVAKGGLPAWYRRTLERYRYGPGVFKVDWALSEPIPWKAKACRRAGTVHLGGTLEEIAASERAAWEGSAPVGPFVILAQPSLFDVARAPAGKHTAWAYCHVPNGWSGSALELIEAQIERFAPGFRECILAKAARGPAEMQAWNENLVGGDINGGAATLGQFVLRPSAQRYATPIKGVYLCSSSTPPGGGVHGMCGYWAAQWAIKSRSSHVHTPGSNSPRRHR